jgi:hypothetical protein
LRLLIQHAQTLARIKRRLNIGFELRERHSAKRLVSRQRLPRIGNFIEFGFNIFR